MKKFEVILCILTVIGLAFKFALFPGGSLLVVIPLLLLSLYYYFLGFALFNNIKVRHIFKRDSYKDTNVLRIFGAILTGWVLSVICIGVLFTVQHFPAGSLYLYCGLINAVLVFIVALIRYFKSQGSYYIRIFKYLAVFTVVCLLFLFVPESAVIKIQYRNHPEYIKAYNELKADPQNEELLQKEKDEYLKATMSEEEAKFFEMKQKEEKKH